MRPPNANCPVQGCKAEKPHTDDFLVKELVNRFAMLDKCLQWVSLAMAELRDSMIADMETGRLFAWYTRMRQIEELYFKTLYVLFLAPDSELPHVLSGETPNSFSIIYDKVNTAIMGGRGELKTIKPGQFRMFDNINDGAHVGFGAMQMIVNLRNNPESLDFLPGYVKHVETYCARVDYMRQMFEGGREKQIVMDAMIRLHLLR